jgi:hypothetical protein
MAFEPDHEIGGDTQEFDADAIEAAYRAACAEAADQRARESAADPLPECSDEYPW